MKIYLSGPIEGQSFAVQSGWRNEMARKLKERGHIVLDPMRHGFHTMIDTDFNISTKIVEADIADVEACDVLIRYAPFPSEGSAMETFYAFRILRKPVITIRVTHSFAPWLVEHSSVLVDTIDEAIEALVDIEQPMLL